jgi:hypothetical protein
MPRGAARTTLLPSAAVTSMPFEGPYTAPVQPFGVKGLNLRDEADQLGPDELSRSTNVDATGLGKWRSRWGQQEIVTSVGANVHSFRRLNDPQAGIGVATRLWGIDTSLHIGLSGALGAAIDTGYSGDPLTLEPLRPDRSGQSWMYVADRSRMRKVRRDGLDLPIGLAKPSVPATALVTQEKTDILAFDTGDTSEAAQWTANQGTAVLAPSTNDGNTGVDPSAHVEFVVNGAGPGGGAVHYSYWGLTRVADLSVAGVRTAEDEDLLHFWMKFSQPSQIEEARLYFVVSPGFDPTILPGTDQAINTNAFMKTFRSSDFSAFLKGTETQKAAIATARQHLADEDFISEIETPLTEDARELRIIQQRDQAKPGVSPPSGPGEHEWVEFGVVGNPIRRGEFERVGRADTNDWDNITGVIIMVMCKDGVAGSVAFDDLYLHGGYGPDTSAPSAAKYDYRVTDFDPRTGTESNPSDEQTEANYLDTARRAITVTPVANGDAAIRQRAYRRGGFNVEDWSRVTTPNDDDTNTSDGGVITDTATDTELRATTTVELDHDEPITTVDSDGTTILAQAVPIIIPLDELLLALGDPFRPGHVYWCRPGEYGHWPPQNNDEVCPPGEELMGGVAWNSRAYLFSRKRMYVAYQNLSAAGTVVTTNTPCHRGLHSRWAVCVGERGVYAVDTDGIYLTTGGLPAEIAELLYPLFHREDKNGYLAIDMSVATAMRLRAMDGRIYFMYRDTGGTNRIAVYDERRQRWLGIWIFGKQPGTIEVEHHESSTAHLVRLYTGGRTTGSGYAISDGAFSDAGTAIAANMRTGQWDGGLQRENKQLGDAILDADPSLTAISAQFRLDFDTVVNAAQTVSATGDGRRRYILDAFGTVPQFTAALSLDLAWSSSNRRPSVYEWGVSFLPIPEETNRRASQYDDLGSANEKYFIGVMIECDTFNVERPFAIEVDLGGAISEVADVSPQGSVTSDGRHRFFFSWPKAKGNLIRLRPDEDCAPWILYKLEWMADREPPRIARVDSNDEERFDTYYTGLDLIINTFGLTKTFEIYVDNVLVKTESVATTGKAVHHVSLTPGYGHIYRYVATDDNPCLLYTHRWFLAPQPSEQTNWNQGFTVAGTRHDKMIKGVVLEVDTFGVQKQVTVEIDGVVADTFNVTTSGRRVIQQALTTQTRGRVLRVYSTDNVKARLWPPPQVIYDAEPLALKRYETQEITHGLDGWQIPVEAKICYRSTDLVTLTVTTVISDSGTSVSDVYSTQLPSTADAKQKRPVFFNARKGLLFKYVFTSPADFYLYREESEVHVQEWGKGDRRQVVKPFGNDDLDAARTLNAHLTQDSDTPATETVEPPVPQAQ